MSEFILHIREDHMHSYILFLLANSGMPTLLKVKPSNLICFQKKYITSHRGFYQLLEKEIRNFHCNYEVLYEDDQGIYILIYNAEMIQNVIHKYKKNSLLAGYKECNRIDELDRNISYLKVRYLDYKEGNMDFPHEIGLFLGYPLEDVESYIKNKGEDYLICGIWKVYHNVDAAVRTFGKYNELKKKALSLLFSGRELNEMLIA